MRVRATVSSPRYNWGSVTHTSVGIVVELSNGGRDLKVDFPQQRGWTGFVSEMEVVPPVHPGVICASGVFCAKESPLVGSRFKCKTCDSFDLCERCFYGDSGHRSHTFIRIAEPGGAAVFAGRPGRGSTTSAATARRRHVVGVAPGAIAEANAREKSGLIEDWSRCVRSMGVSSRENWAYKLTDGTSSYWQSCGSQGKHWIR